MKSTPLILAGATLLAGLVAIEEFRIAGLRDEIAGLKTSLAAAGDTASPDATASPTATIDAAPSPKILSKQERDARAAAARAKENASEFGAAVRKIYENPAGRAMIREENRRRAESIYSRLIGEFDLSEEEADHFLDLLAPSVGEQDRVGMALFNAKSDEERMNLIDQMEADQQARREAIQTFLNDEEDFSKYEAYHARKSEYEQISSIRTVMEESGSPLSYEQESQLIEAMFEARTETGLSEKWEGRQGFYQYAKPGISKRFESDWGDMQGNLEGRIGGFLDEAQQEALQQHQDQIEQFILMGIRMAEAMIATGAKPGGN